MCLAAVGLCDVLGPWGCVVLCSAAVGLCDTALQWGCVTLQQWGCVLWGCVLWGCVSLCAVLRPWEGAMSAVQPRRSIRDAEQQSSNFRPQ